MEIAHLIIPVVTSVVGLAISLLFVVLLSRQVEWDTCTKIGILLGVAICSMYFGICGRGLCETYGLADSGLLRRLSNIMMMSFTPFWPFLVLWSWQSSPILQWKTTFSRVLVVLAFVSGMGIFSDYLRIGPEASVTNQQLSQLLELGVLIFFPPALISIARLPLDPRLRSFIKVVCSVYIFGAIVVVLAGFVDSTILTRMDSVASSFLVLLRLGSILVGLLGSYIVVARFRFVDVFVRWSTRLTILGILSVITTLSFAGAAFTLPIRLRGVGFLGCAFETILLLLMGIVLTNHFERWVEAHVLQRIDLKKESARLHSALFALDSRETVISLLEQELIRTLEAQDVRVLPQDSIPQDILKMQKMKGGSFEIPARFPPFSIGRNRHFEVLVPVPSNGEINEMIGIATGTGRRSLHSGELRFLENLGQQLGVRLDLLQIESSSRTMALRESVLKQQLTEAELRALRAQVNPHFLFNSLNTIADLIVRNPLSAERMTMRLSSVFRHVLAQADRQFVTLAEEFSFLRDYLDIEQERFGENLEVTFEMDPHVAQMSVPTLLLQPLVENALKHGLGPKGGKRSLRVVASERGNSVLLEVIDNGIGFAQGKAEWLSSEAKTSGVGLSNTQARLRAVYGELGRLVIESVPTHGSCVSLSLPKKAVVA